ncbi:hypothetical protein [Alkalihalobacillus sp. LMS39]|uniref:hypothetical protein n=1 Tax=Alkalihalobacillus sp. LMS39 TaxID=2924032 RepID=UPI001FB2924F|nr:hypothetical protein [Alkalihalobacillus sp. LMS39]UOE92228.1 hypothetical protein MM271_13260 [Alkalihalobacillus sp. LMS39]
MKIVQLLFALVVTFMFLSGCGQDQGSDIVRSMEDEQQQGDPLDFVERPSIKEQNRERQPVDGETVSYADQFGYFLTTFYGHITNMKPYFYEDQGDEQLLQNVKNELQAIKKKSDVIYQMPVPEVFQGLHLNHETTRIELNLFQEKMEQQDLPAGDEFEQHRLYYENVVINLKQMEREYNRVIEEVGMK